MIARRGRLRRRGRLDVRGRARPDQRAGRTRPLLIDGDRLGGGIDVLLGIEQAAGARWPELAGTRGRLQRDGAARRAASRSTGCAVLSWDRGDADRLEPEAAAACIDAAVRGYRRVDRRPAARLDAARRGPRRAAATSIVVVVPATVRATAAAARVVGRLRRACPARLLLVVRDPGARPADRRRGRRARSASRSRRRCAASPAVAAAAERGEPPTASADAARWRQRAATCSPLPDEPAAA